MIKMQELQPGDLVMAEYEGQQWEGVVKELNREDKEICVETSVQAFWFKPEDVYPIILDEDRLLQLGFQRQENEDGSIKYSKEAFRILISRPGDFSDFEIWYREDKRRIHKPLYVHELQNHHLSMTKVELNPAG
ncbi:MAG: hypothetical protein EOO04_19575 [Chitinophagaceae bacterium]|nr:MAG: hypothetical protein EOO04_19575 [Chitinophagaceae bacterium]